MPGHPPLHQAGANTSDLHPSYSVWGQGGCYQKNESGNKCLPAADGAVLIATNFHRWWSPGPVGPRAEPRLVFVHLQLQISTKQTYIKITLRNNPNHEGKEIPFFFIFLIQMELFFFLV